MILAQASPEYLKFKNWNDGVIGREVEKLYEVRFTDFIYEIKREISKTDDCLSFIKEINGSFWLIEASCKNKSIRFVGTPIGKTEETGDYDFSVNIKLENIDFNVREHSCRDSVLLKSTENGLIVTSVGSETTKLTGLSLGKPIDSAVQYFNSLETTEILKKSLRENTIVRLPDTFARGDVKTRLFLEIIPLLHTTPYILINFYVLSDELFFKLLKNRVSINTGDFNFNSFIHLAVYGCGDGGKLVVRKANKNFRILSERADFTALIMGKLIGPCLQKRSFMCRTIQIGEISYFSAAVPSDSCDEYLVFLIEYDKMDHDMEQSFKTLTPREREMAKLIVEGYSTKRIAFKLMIAEGTVKKTTSNIYKKLEVDSRVGLLQYIFRK